MDGLAWVSAMMVARACARKLLRATNMLSCGSAGPSADLDRGFACQNTPRLWNLALKRLAEKLRPREVPAASRDPSLNKRSSGAVAL